MPKKVRNIRFADMEWVWLKMVAEKLGIKNRSTLVRNGAKEYAQMLLKEAGVGKE